MEGIILGLLFSFLSGGIVSLMDGLYKKFRPRVKGEKSETYSDKLSRLTDSLQKASGEVDVLLRELAAVAKARTTAAAELEDQLKQLSGREQEMKKRVEELRATPIPVAEHFAALISKGERRSALRDYVLFGMGVVVSTIIAILLRIFGLG